MVVLAVAISTKEGKMLLSRHCGDISKSKVEDCVKNLPKLINVEQQHTFVEHNNLRIIYLPFNTLYLQVISEKNSNIIEDIEILRQLHSIILQCLTEGQDEAQVCDNAIDIILAIDDIITNGNRNSISQSLVLAAISMESNNEKMHDLVMKNREQVAKEKAYEYLHKLESNKIANSETLEGMGADSMGDKKKNAMEDEPFSRSEIGTTAAFETDNSRFIDDDDSSKKTQKSANISTKKGLKLGKKKNDPKTPIKERKNSENESQ